MLAISPLTLSGDEAYYWDWGRNLDWGYYSKPPLIGWLMGLIGWISGASTFGVRVWALLLGSGALVWIFLLTRRLFGARPGFYAAAMAALSPAHATLCQVLTIDAPLLFFWSLSLLAAWRLWEGARWHWGWAAALVAALGGGVLSKQMMLCFLGLSILFLAVEPSRRHWLRRPGWWAIVAATLCFLIPPLWWNARHGWITLEHTGSHFGARSLSFGQWLAQFLEFPLSQLGMLGPIAGALGIASLWMTARRWRRLGAAERMLVVFAGPALAVFLVLALRQRILPNWPAVFYVPVFALFGAWVGGGLQRAGLPRPPLRWAKAGLWLGGALALTLHLAQFFSPYLPTKKDPLERARGWDAYGEAVAEIDQRIFAGEPRFVLVTGHRYWASHLAFYHPENPRVYRWEPSGRIRSQYEIWPGYEASGLNAGLLVVPGGASELPEGLPAAFARCELVAELAVPSSSERTRIVALYRLEIDESQPNAP